MFSPMSEIREIRITVRYGVSKLFATLLLDTFEYQSGKMNIFKINISVFNYYIEQINVCVWLIFHEFPLKCFTIFINQ